ncbi:MAG: bifunctional sulfate adenylyltransferase/adenylylsulfate kinase [Gemmatimonadota bacterium]
MTGIRSELLIPPYGGTLVDLRAPEDALPDFKARASTLPSIQLSDRAVCDLELLAVGAFSPLDRFVGREDYDRILDELRLASGALFPIPVTLPAEPGPAVALDREVALRDRKNNLLATLVIEEIYPWDREAFARAVLGTADAKHPLVSESRRWGPVNLSGRLTVLRLPPHHDFQGLRLTPAEVRERLAGFGRSEVVAFQTRNPLHRVHEELTKRAIRQLDGVLLLHPSVGMTKPGDVDHYTRVRTYQALARHHYEPDRILLSLLPLAMRMAGPREALWHAIIRRNYGASHFIVGRDHAGPGNDSAGKPFYGPYDAQQLVERHAEELEVGVIPFHELTYLPDEDRYEEISKVAPGVRTATISGTQVRDDYLNAGRELPGWFTRPEVARILGEAYPPRVQQGACVWFTGLSGAGKSTTADVLTALLLERGRPVTVLDGDVVRTLLSKGLGFSREDRDLNIRRIAFVASEIVKHGGLVIVAAVSPYRSTREEARGLVGGDRFVEVFVDTPLEECERRDVKGIYAQARRGEIQNFTGISDPYEPPTAPEVTLSTTERLPEENARRILAWLVAKGFLRVDADADAADGPGAGAGAAA